MHLPFPLISTTLTVLLVLLTTTTTHAARPPSSSFCKCVCFNNSTLIDLNPPKPSSTSTSQHHLNLLRLRNPDPKPQDSSPTPPHHVLTCTDCNRAFCLSYQLPICAGAREEDVFTTCFQRDSLKDESVVVLFLFATAGLLGWALLRPWVEKIWDFSRGGRIGGSSIGTRGGTGTVEQNYTSLESESMGGQGLSGQGQREGRSPGRGNNN